jgi:MFS family permease
VLLPGTVLAGVGVAFMIVTGSIAATAGVADEEQGLASGLFNTAQQVGLSLGLAVFVAVSAARSGGAGAGGTAAQVGGFRGALWAGLVFAVAACLSALLAVREKATAASGGESEAAEIPA